MFTGNDLGYFLDYVKEKTGIELEVIGWNGEVPCIYFGSDSEKTIEKIRKACKDDFDDLIKSSNEEENEKKDTELFFKKLHALDKLLGRKLRPDEVLLLATFDSLEVKKDDEKKEDKSNAFLESVLEIDLKDAPTMDFKSRSELKNKCCCEKMEHNNQNNKKEEEK